MNEKLEIDLLDDEYMTPQDAAALRKTLETPPPPPQIPPVLDPADVAEHRRINKTQGQESEE